MNIQYRKIAQKTPIFGNWLLLRNDFNALTVECTGFKKEHTEFKKKEKKMNLKLISYVYIIIAMIIMFIPLSSQLMLRDASGSSESGAMLSSDMPDTEPYFAEETTAEKTERDTAAAEPDETKGTVKDTAKDTNTAANTNKNGNKDQNKNGNKNEGKNENKNEKMIQVFMHSSSKTVRMPLEDYIVGVVMAEMPYNYETEALKAQAVAARSYCLYRMNHGGVSMHDGADVCTSFEHCAAFISEEEAEERYGSEKAKEIRQIIEKAVKASGGEVLLYDGEPIAAMFHSSSYKKTENANNLWGYDVPYLRSVSTPEADVKSELVISANELYSKIGGKGRIPYMSFSLTKNNTGRVDEVTVANITVKAKDLRSVLGLKSCRFELSQSGQNVVFTVHGNGHGIGMSQIGANELAKKGKEYASILMSYYTGVKLGRI